MYTELMSKEEQEKLRHMEQLKRQGREFFKIFFNGPIKRIHALKTISIREITEMDGTVKYVDEETSGVIEPPELKVNPVSGRFETWIFNDPDEYNLYWLARNADQCELEIEDEKIRNHIEVLKTKSFRMPDTRKDQLLIEKRRIDRELRRMEEKEKEIEEKKKRPVKTAEMKTNRVRGEVERPEVNKPEQVKV